MREKRWGTLKIEKETPLPSIILANALSLHNKIEELHAHVRFQHEFRDSCLPAISETWLSKLDSDKELQINGFSGPFRTDHVSGITGETRGEGGMFICERALVQDCCRERETMHKGH